MSILDVPVPPTPFSIAVVEHAFHIGRRFRPPARVVMFTLRPTPFFRVTIMQGYKTEAAAVVTFHF